MSRLITVYSDPAGRHPQGPNVKKDKMDCNCVILISDADSGFHFCRWHCQLFQTAKLTHCGLVVPYDVDDIT